MRLPFKGSYPLTQEFGVNPQYYSQFLVKYPDGSIKPMSGHNGLDFGTPHRTEIIAPHSGEIKEATLDQKGYGYYVKLENEIEGSVIAHLDAIDVQIGFKLNEGDHIGWSDNTGYSTGEHTHWGYYVLPRNRANGIAGFSNQTEKLKEAGIGLALHQLPTMLNQPIPIVTGASGQLYTQEQYDACMNDRKKFWGERDNALRELEATRKELLDLKSVYSTFQAMGYNTVDDVTKAINAKDQDMVGIKKQLVSALQRNQTLADLLAQKDHEDSTAIEAGEQAFEELKALKEGMAEITKVVGAEKPLIRDVVSKAGILKEFAEKWIKKLEREQAEREQVQVEDTPLKDKKSLSELLLSVFDL